MAGSFELMDSLDQARSLAVGTPTAGVNKGEVITVGDLLGFAFNDSDLSSNANDIPDTLTYTLIVQGRKVQVNKDANSISQGNLVYWDGTQVTASSTGNTLIGYALEDATAAATTAVIYFDGNYANT